MLVNQLFVDGLKSSIVFVTAMLITSSTVLSNGITSNDVMY